MHRALSVRWIGLLLTAALATGCGRSAPLGPDDVEAIRILPQDPTLYIEQIVQLTVEGHFVDGSVRDITEHADLKFRLNQTGVVDVLTGARLLARTAGNARLMAAYQGREDTIAVEVLYATLSGIAVDPPELELAVGDYTELEVTGSLSDGSLVDLTPAHTGTTYIADDVTVASVTPDGLVFALDDGVATLHVEHGEHSVDVPVTVGEGVLLLRIEMTPAQVNLGPGEQTQLEVFGHYSDGSVANLTSDPRTSFESSVPLVASVDADGVITALVLGEATVTATHRSATAQTFVRVATGPELTGIDIDPPAAVLSRNGTLQLTVLASYSDGSQEDVTTQATFISSDPQVATVGAAGLVTAVAGGTTLVTVSFGGFQDASRVQVNDRILVALDLAPDTVDLQPGMTFSLEVVGTFDDGSQADLTASSTGTVYRSGDEAVATVGPEGEVTAVSAGQANIEAENAGISDLSLVRVAGPQLIEVTVEPEVLAMSIGQAAQLTVTARYSDGSQLDVSALATYGSADESVARVLAGGLVSAEGLGETTVEASFGGLSDTCQVQVGGELLFIAVQPASALLDTSETLQLQVEAFFSDGSVLDVTDQAEYESSDAGVAGVDATGMVTALAAGTADVEARYGGFEDSCRIQVLAPTLIALEVTPSTLSLDIGGTAQLVVRATYSDGHVQDVTALAGYVSSDPTVASVDGAGLVTAQGGGQASITASFGGLSDTCQVQVSTPTLVSVEVAPPSANLDPSETIQLTATALYSDGSQTDVTSQATWEAVDPGVASVSAAGLVQAQAEGLTTVRASFGGFTDTCSVSVGPATLVSLEVVPPSAVMNTGDTLQLQVLATYSDSSVQDVSAIATYQSSDPAVATVSAGGLVSAVAAGQSNVFARFGGLEATCQVQVNAPTLVSLRVEPPGLTLDIGGTAQLNVWAEYSDTSVVDVTSLATYESSDTAVARVGPAGLVTARGAGLATVVARFGGLAATCQVEVLAPALVSVEVEPESVVLDPGGSVQLTVWANYSDGSRVDVTLVSSYDSSEPLVASAQPNGLVLALSPGAAIITATFGGMSDTCAVAVNAPTLEWIELLPGSAILDVGETLAFAVIGHYSDGSQQDLTAASTGTTYLSSDPGVLFVGPDGLALAVSEGTVTVTAQNSGFDDVSSVTVNPPNPRPVLLSITPDEVLAGSGAVDITLDGTGFVATSVATLDGLNLATTYLSAAQLRATVPASQTAATGAHDVAVTNPPPGGGSSDPLPFHVVGPPAVTTLSPSSGLQGTVVRVVFYGSGLLGCDVVPGNPGISVSGITYTDDGTQLSATFSIGAAAAPGVDPVTLTNLAGSTAVDFTVIEDTPLEDLVINPGEIVYLQGVQAYRNITVGTGAVVFGVGDEPLQFLATGDVMVRGEIHVSGDPGADGYYDPADGGAAGPGGGGGGGGGDGQLDGALPAVGGAGAPPGEAGGGDLGGGTPSGDGGGVGAGSGIGGGCGQAGGGGAFGGDGGGGGGDFGPGTGGPGGLANTQGSDYNGGTGGGGGSTCGPNCGGGGGGGGGVLVIAAVSGGDITVDGALFADGGVGGRGHVGTGGGGGASGGRITVTTEGGLILVNDTISVRGGAGGDADGGDAGGGGGGGRIIVDAGSGSVDDTWGYYDVRGGDAGESRDQGFSGLAGAPGIADIRP